MTSSRITPITAAGDGESTAGRQPTQREHGLALLRQDEAKALISLACGAISETHSVGHEMHTLIYSTDSDSQPDRLERLLIEVLGCWEAADHYLRMLGSVLADFDPQSGSLLTDPGED
jgi:hypothetical protein